MSTDSVKKMRRGECRLERLLPRWLLGRPDGDGMADAFDGRSFLRKCSTKLTIDLGIIKSIILP